jgi:tetratricopeptide (TPR) repeat protein
VGIEYFNTTIKMKNVFYLAIYHKGIVLCDQPHKISEALECFEQVIKLKPTFADGYFYKAKCLINLTGGGRGIVKSANNIIQILEEAIKKDSGHLEAMYYKGVCCLEISAFDDALEIFNYMIEVVKTDARAYYRKGICLTKKGDFSEGKKYMDIAIRMNPNIAEKIMDEY